MFQLLWQPTHAHLIDPTEFVADLPSGGRALIRYEKGVWVATTDQVKNGDSRGVFGSLHDAQAAIEAEEVDRLIAIAIRVGPLRGSKYLRLHAPGSGASHPNSNRTRQPI